MTHPTDTAKSEELKACPMCGSGTARREGRFTNASFSGVEVMDEIYHPYVWCGTCGLRTRSCDSVSEAIEVWSDRAHPVSSPPQNDAGVDWICNGIPDEVIEAGCDAWDRARQEMEDREASDQPEAYRDWDDGMIVAAIFKAMSAALRTPMSELQALGQEFEAGEKRYRHVKRGTFYDVIGHAELQDATGVAVDGARLVIYRGDDGHVWARQEDEFHDGRFAPSAPSGEGRS